MKTEVRGATTSASGIDLAGFARRTVVVVAAGAGLVGILTGTPIVAVALRAAVIAGIGLVAILLVERIAARSRPSRGARGGAR